MLLARHTGSHVPRVHDGKVITLHSNTRWCSDGYEFTCWNGDIVRGAFIIDTADREIISHCAVFNAGVSGSDVRDMLITAVEQRFGTHQAPRCIEVPRQWFPLSGKAHTTVCEPVGDGFPLHACGQS